MRNPDRDSGWSGYILEDFDHVDFAAGELVLDLGCGPGDQMAALEARGCRAVGLDVDRRELLECRRRGLAVVEGAGERLPFADGALGGMVCKVVAPYTDEAALLRESARVLRPGGKAIFTYHGAGYYLSYALAPGSPSWKHRVYGLRTLLGTWCYRALGRRLPGFLGDTIYQSGPRLLRYYDRLGFRLEDAPESGRFLGRPVFIYHVLRRA